MRQKTKDSVQVFVPTPKDPNPYLDEILHYSKHEFIFGVLNSYKPSYSVILINWPEQLFGWKEPSNTQLDDLENRFRLWKQSSSIIYVVHDLERHSGMTDNYRRLFEMVLHFSDSLIHLGVYSKELFQKKYPSKHHEVIYHPLYERSFEIHNKLEARKKLGIRKDQIVFIAPGRIRSLAERKFIISAFNSVKEKDKLLIASNMYYKELNIEFKGRTKLKRVIDVKRLINKVYNFNFNSKFRFNYGFTSFKELSLLMSAADIVIIPRLKILNSGNLFLGLTYRKIIVGPNKGNVLGFLEKLNLPIFNPDDVKSASLAFSESLNLLNKESHYNENVLKEFKPKEVAAKWDIFILKSNIN
ncbi:hypothetical protein E1J38_000555 [Seonamhaeicola sediminis]|uniref:Glycosyltransferase family 4 protein n=1 Tax=Seonamhaeicola sediminis TaxID=2528206 RepID=A0A562YH75_9FLAO|nr:hypothetical protein [Seonamhaeicola sediminis]TWO34373.1 hypothetical protein E1J38_000555 [Seonamhaeicola sediminis]